MQLKPMVSFDRGIAMWLGWKLKLHAAEAGGLSHPLSVKYLPLGGT